MKRTVYISSLVCSLLFSACDVETLQPQAGDTCPLQLGFVQEGNASLVGRNGSGSGRASTLTAEDGNIDKIGVCITGIGHEPYPGTADTRYTFTPDGKGYAGTDIPSDATSPVTIYLNGKDATIQAFHPTTATVSEGSGSNYTIPATISQNQKFNGTAITDATDYLYGSSKNTTGDATAITANALPAANASATIHMHHALAKVVFTLQCDANRTPNTTYDRVKSIRMTANGGTPFRHGTGTMQINNGTLAGGLTGTNELTFTPTDDADPIVIGTNGTAATVACGLVAPLSATPGNITLTITLGAMGSADKDRTYTATYAANSTFDGKWQKGYCYTYNMILNEDVTINNTSVSWISNPLSSNVTTEEQGIGTATKLVEFATAWNSTGDQGPSNSTTYKDYGWEEIDESGKKVFKIKLTGPIQLTGTELEGMRWTPIGTYDTSNPDNSHPLTIPFDGQGWQIVIDMIGTGTENTSVVIPGTYAGLIGYTTAGISNVRMTTSNTINGKVQFSEALYAGALAGKVEGDIINCTVELNGITLDNTNESAPSPMYLGGMVGSCSGSIINSAVYAKSGQSLALSYKKAVAGSYMGGLAGELAGSGKKVNNCYTRITAVSNGAATDTPTAGYLAGSAGAGVIFENSLYVAESGISNTNCTLPSVTPTGITEMTGFADLCQALNAVAVKNNWEVWTEETATAGGVTTLASVYLFNYRNSAKPATASME